MLPSLFESPRTKPVGLAEMARHPDKGLRVLRNGLSHKVTVTQAQISFPGRDFTMPVKAN